ncbi:MAG: NAD-dependent epimerase/dehydratase family protein, partial [Bacteroidales bacterium]
MRVVVSGVSGFIGSRLLIAMQEKGWEVIPLERKDFALDAHLLGIKLSGADVIIHLAGAPIVHRWNEAYKKELHDSRINTTRKLVEALSLVREKPNLFISTSAIGIYSATGRHSEVSSLTADDFIGKLCLDWEKEANHAASITRTVIFRLGIVLAKNGGAFPKMLLPFKFGLGGKIGSGKQGFSWIHIDDLIAAYLFVI